MIIEKGGVKVAIDSACLLKFEHPEHLGPCARAGGRLSTAFWGHFSVHVNANDVSVRSGAAFWPSTTLSLFPSSLSPPYFRRDGR